MSMMRWAAAVLLAGTLAARAGDTGTDPAHKYAWGENIGWANAGPAGHEVMVHYDEGVGGWLTGFIWGENIGWIVMGSPAGGPYANTSAGNWGVNVAADGKLTGYAWGENVGWIRFEQTHGQPAVNPSNGGFSGHAWGENIGWLSFKGTSPDYGVRTLAFDTQPKGTPNYWLARHNVTEDHDAGDGVPAWRKYVMDTDPNVAGDYLRIIAVSAAPSGTAVVFSPASTRRRYTLARRVDLVAGEWTHVAGQIAVPGTGGEQALTDDESAAAMFYRVDVTVPQE